ncbi:MAG: hypothetical protein WBI44_03190 [Syntrophaceticus sp.]
MDEISLSLIIFRYIPEIIIVVSLSLVLTGYEPKMKNVVLIAVVGAPIIAVVRYFTPIPGINTIIVLPVLILLIVYFCKIDVVSSIIVSGLGLIIVGMTEIATIFAATKLIGIDINIALADPIQKLLLPLPEYVFLILLIIVCRRYHLVLLNVRELNDLRWFNDHER